MNDDKNKNNSTSKPKQESSGKQLNKPIFPMSRKVQMYILGGIALFCFIVGPTLCNSHNQPIKTAWGIICVGLICSCVSGRLWVINNRTKHAMPVWLDSTWFCLLCIGICTVTCTVAAWWFWYSPPFKIVSRNLSVAKSNPRTMLFLNNKGKDVLLPIPIELLADFINLRQTPMTIRSYQFEGRDGNGKWVEMKSIDPLNGSVLWFTGTNIDKDHPVLTKSFGPNVWPERIAGVQIGGGDTIPSVVLLDMPTNGFNGALRLRVKDSYDQEYVEDVTDGITNGAATSAAGSAFSFTLIGKSPYDLSHAITNRYSDEMK